MQFISIFLSELHEQNGVIEEHELSALSSSNGIDDVKLSLECFDVVAHIRCEKKGKLVYTTVFNCAVLQNFR